MNKSNLMKDFGHLRDLDLPPLNPGVVSLSVGTNLPHIILHRDFR